MSCLLWIFSCIVGLAAVAVSVLFFFNNRPFNPFPTPYPVIFRASPESIYLNTSQIHGKIDWQTGDYNTFSGVTYIAQVKDRMTNTELWQWAHDYIANNKVLNKFYTPLPVSSYHMTIHPMTTTSSAHPPTPRKFNSYLYDNKEVMCKWHNMTVAQPFAPKGTISGVYAQGIIVLGVSNPFHDEEIAKKQRKDMCKEMKLCVSDDYQSHITLAYRFRRITKDEEKEEIGKEMMELRKHLWGKEIEFEPAHLMLFHDMTAFIPTNPCLWDEQPLLSIPFTDPKQKSHKEICGSKP